MDAIPQRVKTSRRRPLGRQVQRTWSSRTLSCLAVLSPEGMRRSFQPRQTRMKQGPFPHPRLCCASGSSGTTGPSATHPAERDFANGLYAPTAPGHAPADPGPGRASPVSASTIRPFRSLYRERFIAAASRLYTASMAFALNSRAGSSLSRERASVTRRQDSLHVTDRPVASPKGAFDTGLRHRAFPPDAASLLPGALALTGTGLTPAGRCELMFRSGHPESTTPELWARELII